MPVRHGRISNERKSSSIAGKTTAHWQHVDVARMFGSTAMRLNRAFDLLRQALLARAWL